MQLLLTLALLFPAQEPAAPATPAAFTIGQPAPDLQIDRWLVEPKPKTSSSSSSGTGKRGEPLVSGSTQRWSNYHEAKIVFHAPLAGTLPLLAELADAGSDRALSLVGWTIADDETKAREVLKRVGEGAWLGVPKSGSPLGPLTPELLVIGPNGELVWAGTGKDEKGFVAAVDEALARPRAKALGAPLAPELAPALTEYWKGAWAKARGAADTLAKKGGSDALVTDAKRIVAAVDELERDLGVAAQDAVGKMQLHELVEIEWLLGIGIPGPTQKRVSEMVKDIAGKSLQGGSADDARKWLEIAARRPLFFPARDESAGERYAKELEQFVKRSSNLTGPQQRALALLERWKQRKGH